MIFLYKLNQPELESSLDVISDDTVVDDTSANIELYL